MRKNLNSVTLIGRIYNHSLTEGTVKNTASKNYGAPFISGDLCIATDDEGLNVIPIHYTYVAPTFANGSKNNTFTTLKNIIDNGLTWEANGAENAWVVKCEPQLAVNDFIARDGTMVSAQRAEGGFVTVNPKLNRNDEKQGPNRFSIDCVIDSVIHVDADPENGVNEDYAKVSGYAFNFRNELLPCNFVAYGKHMDYFEDAQITKNSPLYLQLRGNIVSATVVKEIEEKNVFGDTEVRYVERHRREWVISGSNDAPYDIGDPDVMSADEYKEALAKREITIAEVKKRDEDYKASKNSAPAAATAPANKTGSADGKFSRQPLF